MLTSILSSYNLLNLNFNIPHLNFNIPHFNYNNNFNTSVVFASLYVGFYLFGKSRYRSAICSNNFTGDVSHLVSYTFSTIHATTVSTVSILNLLNLIDNSKMRYIYLLGLGYMVADLGIIYYDKKFRKDAIPYTLHHGITIASYYSIINNLFPEYINSYAPLLLLSETNIPALNYSWYLIHTNRRETTLFKISSRLSILLYFIFRICNLSYMTYILYNLDNGYYSLPLGVITGLNYNWFYRLIKSSF